MNEYLSPADLADLLKVPLETVRRWRKHGQDPPAIRIGKHVRYQRAGIDAWLATKKA